MRQVQRGPAPEGFNSQAEAWQAEFETTQAKNPKLTPDQFWSKVRQRKAMKSYAQTLYKMFHVKCVFCEQIDSRLQIEHYRPKSSYIDQMFMWENWLLACGTCNTNKGTQFPLCKAEPCFIDPASEDPTEHVGFEGSRILYKTERGKHTIDEIELNRLYLMEARQRWLLQIDSWLWLLLHVPEIKSKARELLIWSMQPDAPFSAMTLAYLSNLTPQLAHPETPHPIIKLIEPQKHIHELVQLYKAKLKHIV